VTGEQQPVDPGENQLVADDAKDAHETAGEEYLETYTYQWRVFVGCALRRVVRMGIMTH
jgi:hypothetical protein